jgi:hypothetical protein
MNIMGINGAQESTLVSSVQGDIRITVIIKELQVILALPFLFFLEIKLIYK